MSTGAKPAPSASSCFHCGQAVPRRVAISLEIDGEARAMCCPGCRAVAATIVDAGLVDYYRRREAPGLNAEVLAQGELDGFAAFDSPELQREFVRDAEGGGQEATFGVEGIQCVACAWLIERHLGEQPGVREVAVSTTSHRARLVYDPDRISVSQLLRAFPEIGYQARPHTGDRQEQALRAEQRLALRRLGVAGLGTMQVMMLAVALYAGALEGMEERYRLLLRVVSLLVATPVVLYSARPFFQAAWRDLRVGQPGMDVPVALAIGAAYVASVWATATRSGDVYFDSVCMFTFFLGVGRYLELRARQRADGQARRLLARVPQVARRLRGAGLEDEEVVSIQAIGPGDRVVVRPGETIPADGVVLDGVSPVNEALLTGEEMPRTKRVGDAVVGGSINVESALVVEVARAGAASTLSTIVGLLDRAQAEKPPIARQADRVARYFVASVLLVAAAVAVTWWQIRPEDAFWITLSVLVATCPCALSLATPVAVAASTNGLAEAGLLVTRGHVLEGLARATHIVFDKTGTLTLGRIRVLAIVPVGGVSAAEVAALAAVVERRSEHPIGRALASAFAEPEARALLDRWRDDAGSPISTPGRGVECEVAGRRVRVGRPDWAAEILPHAFGVPESVGDGTRVLLAGEDGVAGWIELGDEMRDEGPLVAAELRDLDVELELLSGDPSGSVARLAGALGIARFVAGADPAAKVAHVRELQENGALVAMVGDGINDAPVLGQAQVSIAMGGGSDLARIGADAVLLGDHLGVLAEAIRWSRKTLRIVRQNLGWAIVYNLTVLPLAACGYVAPYVAALGMSASSLLVVLNALRLGEVRSRS